MDAPTPVRALSSPRPPPPTGALVRFARTSVPRAVRPIRPPSRVHHSPARCRRRWRGYCCRNRSAGRRPTANGWRRRTGVRATRIRVGTWLVNGERPVDTDHAFGIRRSAVGHCRVCVCYTATETIRRWSSVMRRRRWDQNRQGGAKGVSEWWWSRREKDGRERGRGAKKG